MPSIQTSPRRLVAAVVGIRASGLMRAAGGHYNTVSHYPLISVYSGLSKPCSWYGPLTLDPYSQLTTGLAVEPNQSVRPRCIIKLRGQLHKCQRNHK